MSVVIDEMQPGDWEAVRAIYIEGISTGTATFETAAPTWEAWNDSHLQICRLTARREGEVIGWAAINPISSRACYAGVAEVSIYVSQAARGQGIGRALLLALIEQSEQAGIWTLQSSLFAQNTASRALHEAAGFRVVGYRERIARRDGVWQGTILLERRSKIVGK